ncbi:MAG: replication initiation protein [Pseudomonadota bacterium]
MAPPSKPFRAIDAQPNAQSLVKPGELVDLVEVTPLTLADRRIYNLLLENAWDAIEKPVTHAIPKAALRGSHNSNDRLGESVERLMAAIVKLQVVRDGKASIERVQLLGGNIEHRNADGVFYYEIPARLRRIIKDSVVFARIQKEVMFALSSKYALTLYEMVQKRGNLTFKSSETFTLEALRGVLGVPPGKLETWSNLYNRAIRPAVEEVSQLSAYLVEVEPVKTGRRVTGVTLRWRRKDGEGENAAARELGASKIGRAARRSGEGAPVAEVATSGPPIALDRAIGPLAGETFETARLRHPGYDVYFVEQEWRIWSADKEPPRDADKAFLAFFRSYAERNPL